MNLYNVCDWFLRKNFWRRILWNLMQERILVHSSSKPSNRHSEPWMIVARKICLSQKMLLDYEQPVYLIHFQHLASCKWVYLFRQVLGNCPWTRNLQHQALWWLLSSGLMVTSVTFKTLKMQMVDGKETRFTSFVSSHTQKLILCLTWWGCAGLGRKSTLFRSSTGFSAANFSFC